jgi:hypothetical protein
MVFVNQRTRRLLVSASVLALLTACANHGNVASRHGYGAPGPASDPWGPYIREASAKYHVPEQWIRAVMHQESGGHEFLNGRPTTSSAGASGLMQVMPGTYAELAARYNLGDDRYDPHDNIMAGTAYLRELYEKYGSPGFLAAYNAGPGRMDAHLAGRRLPAETRQYVAAISPNLGDESPDQTPVLTAYEPGGRPAGYSRAPVDTSPIPPSYVAPVPDEPPARVQVASALPAVSPANNGEPPDLSPIPPSYVVPVDDDPAPQPPSSRSALRSASAAPLPLPPPMPAAMLPNVPRAERPPEYRLVQGRPYAATAMAPRPVAGEWAIQVGAYNTPALARVATEGARQGANLIGGEGSVTEIRKPGSGPLYRARLTGLSRAAAHDACTRLRTIGSDCILVAPGASGGGA